MPNHFFSLIIFSKSISAYVFSLNYNTLKIFILINQFHYIFLSLIFIHLILDISIFSCSFVYMALTMFLSATLSPPVFLLLSTVFDNFSTNFLQSVISVNLTYITLKAKKTQRKSGKNLTQLSLRLWCLTILHYTLCSFL